ncbi:MAG: DNA gyrase subunit A [Phycisphaerae bacterium]|nr:DNA gyrase subunit A [Phycisphaerae bacterium]
MSRFDASERVEELLIEEEMKNSYLTYSMSVIMSRALPDVRDGLKPSQRRILVAMNDLNLGPRSKHRKCAKIVGDTSGNYHPHGDQATYGTLVRMAQHFSMRYPLVDPQGNFGTIDGDPPAAMRYTEARLASPAMELLADLRLDTVDFVPNYDETRNEPVVLPGKFPNLLVNGSQGIAVGMATSCPPHNLTEVCNALIALIEKPDLTVKDLLKIIPGPDFPTGGFIAGRSGILKGYSTGRGIITNRARLHTEQGRGGKTSIVVDEMPYQILKQTVIDRIVALVKDGKLTDIADVRDESDRESNIRLVIELKREGDEQVVINQLYKHTPLQSTFSIMNIVLVDGRPMTLPLKDLLQLFIEHRVEVISRRTRHLLAKARQRAHILEGLILAVSDIDEIIELIKTSPDAPTARQRLMDKPIRLKELATLSKLLPEKFIATRGADDQFLTGPQADAILIMQLQRLTGLEIEKLAKEYNELAEEIAGYERLLSDERNILDVVREDCYELREKYGDERRTQIIDDVADLDVEDLIAEEHVVVTVSRDGYIKRMPLNTYRRQGRGGRGIRGSATKEEDIIEHLFTAVTHDYLLVFTNMGQLHWIKVYDIPQMSRTSKGRAIVNLLNLRKDETVAAILPVREFGEGFVVMATRKGIIKKTELAAYSRPKRGGIIACSLKSGDDEVIGVALTTGNDEIVLGTRGGMAARFKETDVRPMGRHAAGVRGIRLKKDDAVVDMAIADKTASLLTVCQSGYGKRTEFEEYRLIGRGGQGVINIKTSDRNGPVIALKSVREEDELMLITAKGIITRIAVSPVRKIGRGTQGVRLQRLDEGDTVVAVTRIIPEPGNGDGDDQRRLALAGSGEEDLPDDAAEADESADEAADAEDVQADDAIQDEPSGDDDSAEQTGDAPDDGPQPSRSRLRKKRKHR